MKQIRKGRMVYEGFEFAVTAVYDEADECLPPWDEDAELVGRRQPGCRASTAPSACRGAARFTVDIQLPRMLHAAVLRSPVANGARRARSTSRRRARAPGVRAVIGPDEPIGDGRSPLTREPQFVGAPIAAVAAETLEQARAALALLAPADRRAAVRGRPRRGGLRAQRFAGEPTEHVRGEPELLRAGEVQVELEVETQFHIQTPIEPHAAVADWQEDELTVWFSTQGIFARRATSSRRASGCRADAVRVIAEFIGGGFGSKIERRHRGDARGRALAPDAPAGQPACFTRHEEQLVGGHRAATHQTIRLGARRATARSIALGARVRDRHGLRAAA